jgi:hypothetical protein
MIEFDLDDTGVERQLQAKSSVFEFRPANNSYMCLHVTRLFHCFRPIQLRPLPSDSLRRYRALPTCSSIEKRTFALTSQAFSMTIRPIPMKPVPRDSSQRHQTFYVFLVCIHAYVCRNFQHTRLGCTRSRCDRWQANAIGEIWHFTIF